MRTVSLNVGFMPLVDSAPLVIARELGFAEEEGLDLSLQGAPSWSTLRDRLALGQIEAAHMLSPVPIAMALGLGGMATRFDALCVLSINGNVIGISREMAQDLKANGTRLDFLDATKTGQALSALNKDIRIGVPFPFSMHAELLYYWLDSIGLPSPQGLDVRTIPPPLMSQAIAAGEIDAFCVGEPWGSIAVENGHGELILPGQSIWQFAPEKVLAVRHDWAEAEQDLTGRLMRAVWKAGRWLEDPTKLSTIAEVLSWPEYLGVSAEIIERALSGRMVISQRGETRRVPRMVGFFEGAANFPWKSQAAWIGNRMATRFGLDRVQAAKAASDVFRSDLYRKHLATTGAEMPGASQKVEGAISVPTAVASKAGTLILQPNRFFNGAIFDSSQTD